MTDHEVGSIPYHCPNVRDNRPKVNQQERDAIKRIEQNLMAPCCYTQTIDVHVSEIAEKMRAEVFSMTLAGKTETEILGFYKTLYGEQILSVPDGTLGQLVFAVPIAAAAIATGTLLLVLSRFHRRKLEIRSKALSAPFEVSEAVREEICQQTAW